MREMTKLYEERFYGSTTDAINHFKNPKGEITLILEPIGFVETLLEENEIVDLINKLRSEGLKTKAISMEITKVTNLNSSESYKKILESNKKTDP